MLAVVICTESPVVRRDRTGWTEDQILGDELRIAREALKMSQTQLGQTLFLSRQVIGEIESGDREISRKDLAKWAKATGRTVASFERIVAIATIKKD